MIQECLACKHFILLYAKILTIIYKMEEADIDKLEFIMDKVEDFYFGD